MTTEAASSRPLSPVTTDEAGPDWRAETVLRQWDPEAQLVGALMHLPAAHAAPITQLVPDTAIWRPDNRWAYEIIRHLVDGGRDPDPVVVLRTARHRPPADAVQPGEPVSAARHHRFAVHLADVYTQAVSPNAVRQYAREVLDDAYRRAAGFHGIRLTQLAESGAPRGPRGPSCAAQCGVSLSPAGGLRRSVPGAFTQKPCSQSANTSANAAGPAPTSTPSSAATFYE